VLYVNLITAITLGMALAVEPAEQDIMQRPPRRPGKRLLGKLILWRCFFVSSLIVVLVLGMYEWGAVRGLSLERRRAEAFNTLVFCEIGYAVTTRFIKQSTLHLRAVRGNPLMLLSILVTAGLQCLLTYTPGLNAFFSMPEAMDPQQWAHVIGCMVVVYFVVEAEKALVSSECLSSLHGAMSHAVCLHRSAQCLPPPSPPPHTHTHTRTHTHTQVDPLLMPIVRPVLTFIDDHSPNCLHYRSRLVDKFRTVGGRRRKE